MLTTLLLCLLPQSPIAVGPAEPRAEVDPPERAGGRVPAPAAARGAVGPTLRFGDFDGDGLEDLYAVRPAAGDRLLRNLGDGTFVDVTDASGLAGITGSRQALWCDYDGDGHPDLYVCAADGDSRLLRNDRDASGLFVDVTRAAGVAHADGAELHAAWIDFDLDRRPDLHLVTPAHWVVGGDRLFRNTGRGLFELAALPVPSDLDGGVIAVDLGTGSGGAPGGGGTSSPLSGPGGYSINPAPGNPATTVCLPRIEDQAGGCLEASSSPVMGKLYPLSPSFMVSPNGNVGIGVGTPSKKLQVEGEVWAVGDVSGRTLVSMVADGTPPLAVTSTTTVPNLSADSLDGLDASAFTQLGQSIDGLEVEDGSLTALDLASGSVTSSALAGGAVTQGKIAALAVGSAQIQAGAVGSSELASGAVGTAELQAGAVTPDRLDTSSATSGSVLAFDGASAAWTGIPGSGWTRIDSLPYFITAPGTYYLASDLSHSDDAILVAAEGVTLDLMGHVLECSNPGVGTGIFVSSFLAVTIRNGTIRDFGEGIQAVACRGVVVENVQVGDCTAYGMLLGPSAQVRNSGVSGCGEGISVYRGGTVTGCTTALNTGRGIAALDAAVTITGCSSNSNQTGIWSQFETVVVDCTVGDNQEEGIRVGAASTVVACASVDNGKASAADGIWTGDGSTVADCAARDNSSSGIQAGSGSTVRGCSAVANQLQGIAVGSSSVVESCATLSNSAKGISAGEGSVVRDCTARQNLGDGVAVGFTSLVEGCVARQNGADGILAAGGTQVRGCTSSSNAGDGIEIANDGLIADNTCDGNGTTDGAGIHATSTDNRIDSNNVTDNDRGIDVDAGGCLIIRNSAAGNSTNYDLAGTNDYGQISTGGAGFSGVDPWANFSF